MHKIVNGVKVELSEKEAADIQAEWKRNEPKPSKTDEEILAEYDAMQTAEKQRIEQAALRDLIKRYLVNESNRHKR